MVSLTEIKKYLKEKGYRKLNLSAKALREAYNLVMSGGQIAQTKPLPTELVHVYDAMKKGNALLNLELYMELEYSHPTHPKRIYMLGETHRMSGCLSEAVEPEDIIRVIQYTSNKPVDIYVEAYFPSKKLQKKVTIEYRNAPARMRTYAEKYSKCNDFEKVGCDIHNARFHYIDTRETTYFPAIIQRYLHHSLSMFRLYAILSRPNYYQDIKQYYFDIIDGNDMDRNPIHQIETFQIVPSRMNLPHVKQNLATYLDGTFNYVKQNDIFDTALLQYISDFKYLVKKVQRQFKNCEPEFVKYVRKGLDNYLDEIQGPITKTFETYKKQIEGVFGVIVPGDTKSYTPITMLNWSHLLLHVLIQDLYGIGRMFRVKWSKPHVYGTNHVLYTGALHSMSTYKLLEFVPQIKAKALTEYKSENCSVMVDTSDLTLELKKRWLLYTKMHT